MTLLAINIKPFIVLTSVLHTGNGQCEDFVAIVHLHFIILRHVRKDCRNLHKRIFYRKRLQIGIYVLRTPLLPPGVDFNCNYYDIPRYIGFFY